MPTHTPSPHRFLAPSTADAQKRKPPAPSNLRHATNTTPASVKAAPKPELQFKKLVPAKRYIFSPKQSLDAVSHTLLDGLEERGSKGGEAQPYSTAAKPKRTLGRVESIQEASQSSPTALAEIDGTGHVLQSVEHDMFNAMEESDEDETEDEEMLFETIPQSKRQRTSSPVEHRYHRDLAPQTPAPVHQSSHRFKVAAPRTPAAFANTPHSTSDPTKAIDTTNTPVTTGTAIPALQRPQFILPALPLSPVKPSKPLPEIFSPSRKAGKYVPDGLASTMTAWIIECANTGYVAQERNASILWGREGRDHDGVKVRLRVKSVSSGKSVEDGATRAQEEVECFPGGVTYVLGDTDPSLYNASRAPSTFLHEDGELKVLLAGSGGARGTSGIKVRSGSIIGIRAPTWEVKIQDIEWTVAVDWVLFS